MTSVGGYGATRRPVEVDGFDSVEASDAELWCLVEALGAAIGTDFGPNRYPAPASLPTLVGRVRAAAGVAGWVVCPAVNGFRAWKRHGETVIDHVAADLATLHVALAEWQRRQPGQPAVEEELPPVDEPVRLVPRSPEELERVADRIARLLASEHDLNPAKVQNARVSMWRAGVPGEVADAAFARAGVAA